MWCDTIVYGRHFTYLMLWNVMVQFGEGREGVMCHENYSHRCGWKVQLGLAQRSMMEVRCDMIQYTATTRQGNGKHARLGHINNTYPEPAASVLWMDNTRSLLAMSSKSCTLMSDMFAPLFGLKPDNVQPMRVQATVIFLRPEINLYVRGHLATPSRRANHGSNYRWIPGLVTCLW